MPEVTNPPVWRKDGQTFPARPICRTCAERHQPDVLTPFLKAFGCSISKCENMASYLAVDRV